MSNEGVIRSKSRKRKPKTIKVDRTPADIKQAEARTRRNKPRPTFKSLHALKAVNVAGLPYYDYKDLGGLNAGDKLQRRAAEILLSTAESFFNPNCAVAFQPLPIGTVLRLERESNNPKDALAVAIIEVESGYKLGYIPRTQNATLARLMDAGYPLFAAVLEHNYALPISNFERITVAVYIEKWRKG